MIGDTDGDIRRAVFDWLTQNREETAHETFTRDELSNFQFRGRRVPLVGPQGIWKPAECELPALGEAYASVASPLLVSPRAGLDGAGAGRQGRGLGRR